MTEQLMINAVHSASTHIPGRALNSVGVHHFVIDGSTAPKEELTPVDVFLAGISSCAVHMIERFAGESNVRLERVEADIEGIRRADEPSRFERVNLRLELQGPSQAEAEDLVERFKGR
jgi:uncharacterized OsmC-like protein